jgi:phosphatidylglycerophosphatase A
VGEGEAQMTRLISKFFVKLFSTFFYIGYLPFMPGTFGSLAGAIIFVLVKNSLPAQLALTLLILAAGFMVSAKAEKAFNKKDPPYIVIDEVAGMLVSLLFLPFDMRLVIAAFLLFRFMDILKPYPANRIQDLKGSLGVMGDDLAAGIYVNIILQVFIRLASFKAS